MFSVMVGVCLISGGICQHSGAHIEAAAWIVAAAIFGLGHAVRQTAEQREGR